VLVVPTPAPHACGRCWMSTLRGEEAGLPRLPPALGA
jgi:hypothetical protein